MHFISAIHVKQYFTIFSVNAFNLDKPKLCHLIKRKINILPNDKTLDWTRLKAFSEGKLL